MARSQNTKITVVRSPARPAFAFGFYLLVIGLVLLFVPNLLLNIP
jgi:hypothetical protein